MSVQKNAGKVEIRLQVLDQDGKPVDLSSAASLSFKFKKPDGTTVIKQAELSSNSNCEMVYVTDDAFFDQAKKWEYQGLIDSDTYSGPTEINTFLVKDNL